VVSKTESSKIIARRLGGYRVRMLGRFKAEVQRWALKRQLKAQGLRLKVIRRLK